MFHMCTMWQQKETSVNLTVPAHHQSNSNSPFSFLERTVNTSYTVLSRPACMNFEDSTIFFIWMTQTSAGKLFSLFSVLYVLSKCLYVFTRACVRIFCSECKHLWEILQSQIRLPKCQHQCHIPTLLFENPAQNISHIDKLIQTSAWLRRNAVLSRQQTNVEVNAGSIPSKEFDLFLFYTLISFLFSLQSSLLYSIFKSPEERRHWKLTGSFNLKAQRSTNSLSYADSHHLSVSTCTYALVFSAYLTRWVCTQHCWHHNH